MNSYIIDMIKRHEGVRYRAYKDSLGIWTWGVGRNLEGVGLSTEEQKKIFGKIYSRKELIKAARSITLNIDQINLMLENDLLRVEKELKHYCPELLSRNETLRYVLIDMCFNLGIYRLKKFKKMFKALYAEDYKKASKEMMKSKWSRQVKGRAVELSNMVKNISNHKKKQKNMNLIGLAGKVFKAVVPSLSREKDKLAAVDSLLSNRGDVTKWEVYYALTIKLINLMLYVYIVWAIINDKVSLLDSIKLLLQ